MGHIEIGSEEVRERYHKILVNNGIEKEIKEVLIIEPELRGEHMASACDYVTIKFADDSEDLDLFVKRLINYNTPGMDDFSKEMSIFEKEAEFFNSILPDAKQFCIEKTGNDNLINFFPKSYYGDEKNIVLENLIKRNYFMLDKFDRQDLQQAEIVIDKLAKFHGVLHALITELGQEIFSKKYPFAFKEAFLNPKMAPMMDPWFDNGLNTCIKIVEANDLENGKEAIEWLQSQLGKTFTTLRELIKSDGEPLLVLNHGDCWNNNMMFLKDENGTITDHLLIDMQILRYGSPNLDLSYFLYTSVKPEVRRKHWKSLLKTYYDTLCKTASMLGASIDTSYDELTENFRKKCLMGIYMAISVMSTIGAMKEIDMESFTSDSIEEVQEYFANVINKWVENNPESAKAISKDTIEVVVEYKALTGQS